ncbi:hypothetical protein ACTG9Q_06925 [Actinokineospora sp. 24-640]
MADQRKIKGAFRLAGAMASTTSAVATIKTARLDKDHLSLVNALASILVAVTGVMLAVRALRSGK